MLAIVFLWSGSAKVQNAEKAGQAIVHFGLTRRRSKVLGFVAAVIELSLGLFLAVSLAPGIAGIATVVAFSSAALILSAFAFIIFRSLRRGERFECFCFGGRAVLSVRTLLRAVLLALLASLMASAGPAILNGISAAEFGLSALLSVSIVSSSALASAAFDAIRSGHILTKLARIR